jgi:hypothetical protein
MLEFALRHGAGLDFNNWKSARTDSFAISLGGTVPGRGAAPGRGLRQSYPPEAAHVDANDSYSIFSGEGRPFTH